MPRDYNRDGLGYHRARRGASGSLWMPAPKENLPTPAGPPPESTEHGRRGCGHPIRGTRQPPVFRSAVGHDAEVFTLFDFACRNGIVSETQTGDMKIQIDEPWRSRLLDSFARMAERHPACIVRSEGMAWQTPCPNCGRHGYNVTVVA